MIKMFLTLGWLAVALLGAARLCAMLALGPLGSALATVHLCSSEALVTGAAALAVVSFFALEGGSLDELVGWFADWTAPCGELELELHMYQKRFLDRLAVDKQLTGRVSWVGDDGTVRELEEEAVADPKASEALRLILQAVLDDPEAQQEIFGQVQCRCDAQHHKDGTEAFPFTLSVAQETFLHAKLLPCRDCGLWGMAPPLQRARKGATSTRWRGARSTRTQTKPRVASSIGRCHPQPSAMVAVAVAAVRKPT